MTYRSNGLFFDFYDKESVSEFRMKNTSVK